MYVIGLNRRHLLRLVLYKSLYEECYWRLLPGEKQPLKSYQSFERVKTSTLS